MERERERERESPGFLTYYQPHRVTSARTKRETEGRWWVGGRETDGERDKQRDR